MDVEFIETSICLEPQTYNHLIEQAEARNVTLPFLLDVAVILGTSSLLHLSRVENETDSLTEDKLSWLEKHHLQVVNSWIETYHKESKKL